MTTINKKQLSTNRLSWMLSSSVHIWFERQGAQINVYYSATEQNLWKTFGNMQEDLEFKPRQGCSVWSVHVLSMLAWVVSRRSGFSHFWEKNSYRLLWAQDTPTKETDFMSFTSWLDNVTCERSSGHWKMILNIFWNVKGHLFLMDTSGNVSNNT